MQFPDKIEPLGEKDCSSSKCKDHTGNFSYFGLPFPGLACETGMDQRMRTHVDNGKPLSLAELMGIAGEMRLRGTDTHLLPAAGLRLKEAVACFMRFRRNTRMALLVYLMFLVLLIGSLMAASGWYTVLMSAFCCIGFMGFLLAAYSHQASFYSILGRSRTGGNPLLLLCIGIPLYLWLHYHLERDMRKALSGLFRELGLVQTA